MGWEQCGNGLYYYSKKREGKRVVSEYVGTGFSGSLIAILDKEDREKRELAHAQWKDEKAEVKKIEMNIERLNIAIRGIVHASLLTSGFHPHKGQWRKKRNV